MSRAHKKPQPKRETTVGTKHVTFKVADTLPAARRGASVALTRPEYSDDERSFVRLMHASNRRPNDYARVITSLFALAVSSLCIAQTSTQVEGLYLDLENISPNNVLGATQQAGGLFVQGGFVCAVSSTLGVCNSGGGGPVGGYGTVIYNEPSPIGNALLPAGSSPISLPPFHQLTVNPPAYSALVAQNGQSIAYNTGPYIYGNSQAFAALGYSNGGNQIGFTLATSSNWYGIAGTFSDGTSYPDLVGLPSPSLTPNWVFEVFDSATNQYAATNVNKFLTTTVNCSGSVQNVNLLNCNNQLAPVVPFPQNVSFSLNTQGNIITPTFSWTQASGYTPDVFRMEIWQINGSGVAASGIFSVTLPNTTTQYTVPSTFTNLTTGQPSSLQAGQEYAIDIENITLRNPASSNVANDNIWSRSRSFFDFTPTMTVTDLPTGTSVSIPVVSAATGTTTYVFNQSVTAGSTTYIDPAMATGYIFQTGSGNPNFTSVTPISTIGSGVYQLYTQTSGGGYVFATNIQAGQTYTFSGSGVSSFEIQGIPASADIDPSNTSAFVTGLTFAGSGQFTGTMTPIVASASTAANSTDGPIPVWALGALGAGLVGIASRRLKKAA